MIKIIEKQIADSINVKQKLLASPALLLRIEETALTSTKIISIECIMGLKAKFIVVGATISLQEVEF